MTPDPAQPEAATASDFVPALSSPRRVGGSAATFGRLVVASVVALVLLVSLFALLVGRYFAAGRVPVPVREVEIGPFTVLVSSANTPSQLVVLSLFGIVLVAVFAVTFEAIAAFMTVSPRRKLLRAYRHEDISLTGDPLLRVTCLIPAHNEESALPLTLAALAHQSRSPDRVVVVADNCTDRTAEIAVAMGHEVFETVGNTDRKAGALNQALAQLLPRLDESDVILVMDADTSLNPRFIEVGADRLASDPELSGVGGVFYGEDGRGLLGQFQRNEYARYSLQIRARHGRVFVLTGTATMFRSDALLDVAAARGVFIPGAPGRVYDPTAITEDNELTLALKSLGATMTSPAECQVTTEIMPTWRNLWVQRKRWQRGALENLASYGLTRATLRYWGQQVGIGYGTVALSLALLLMLLTFLAIDEWVWYPLWIAMGAVFVVERTATVWRAGWRARGLAVLMFPEICYAVFLQVVFVKCLIDIVVGRRTSWGHVQHQAASSP